MARRQNRAAKDSQWAARWRAPDGKSREKRFVKKIDAERHLTTVEHSKLTGAYVDPSAGKVTFRAYAERWQAAQVHRLGTATQVETNLRRHVYPKMGHRPLGAIRPSEVQARVKGMSTADGDRKRWRRPRSR
jgi:hypothetical protein